MAIYSVLGPQMGGGEGMQKGRSSPKLPDSPAPAFTLPNSSKTLVKLC